MLTRRVLSGFCFFSPFFDEPLPDEGDPAASQCSRSCELTPVRFVEVTALCNMDENVTGGNLLGVNSQSAPVER